MLTALNIFYFNGGSEMLLGGDCIHMCEGYDGLEKGFKYTKTSWLYNILQYVTVHCRECVLIL